MIDIIEAEHGSTAQYLSIRMGSGGYYESWNEVELGEPDKEGRQVIAIILGDRNSLELLDWITTETPRETVENFGTDGEAVMVLEGCEHKNIDYLRNEIELYNDCFA